MTAPLMMLCPAGTPAAASSRLRCHGLARELARLGCRVLLGPDSSVVPDLLYVQKRVTAEILALAQRVRAAGGRVVFDIDDYGSALDWVKADPALFADFLALVDAVSVDTELRAEIFRKDPGYAAVPEFWVVPDPVDYIDDVAAELPERRFDERPLLGCWFGNAPNANPALPYMQAALQSQRVQRLSVITNAEYVPQLQQAWPMLAVEPWRLESFAARLREHDFCLLVHDTSIEGVQKSNNKMLAALGQGVVPLVSNTPAYAELAHKIGVPGLLLDRPQDLLQRLQPAQMQALAEGIRGEPCRRALREFLPSTVAAGFLERAMRLLQGPARPAATPAVDHLAELQAAWRDSPHPTTKISTYFPAYAKLFSHLRGRPCTFIETGVLNGGSLFMWRRWLGPQARIIGIDLNPAAERWREDGFQIFIGDQGDPAFWRDTLGQIGRFDVLLDDGGHQSFQQIVTVREALRGRRDPCLVVVEDTATSFMRDFARHGPHSFLEYAKDATDCLVGRSFGMFAGRFPDAANQAAIDEFSAVGSVEFFNGIVAFTLDPASAATPRLLENRRPTGASDFRYEGASAATVDWPDVLQPRRVKVQGGAIERPALPAGPVRLNLGSGGVPLPGYVNVDLASERAGRQPDIVCDIRDLAILPDACADEVLSVHVIEHFYRWEVAALLKEWVRVLKPGGKLVLETPNLITACEELLKNPDLASAPDARGQRTMWCLYGDPQHRDPLMCHRWLYTPQSLAQVMHEAGLRQLEQTPPHFKLGHPRDMRIEGTKPQS